MKGSRVKGSRLGPLHPMWTGGRKLDNSGHVLVYTPGHPRASKHYVPEHILIVEKAIGKFLPVGVVVHHHNEDKADNANTNLVVLQNQGEHVTIHARRRVQLAGGDPHRDRMCAGCGPKAAEHFYLDKHGRFSHRCRECRRLHERTQRVQAVERVYQQWRKHGAQA